jgi:uncharacterized protein (DUF58 family)
VPANRWLPLLAAMFLLGALLDLPFLTTLSAALAVLIGTATWWSKHSLDGILYRRRPHYRRAFPGEQIPLRLEVENKKLLPISWLRVEDPWPLPVGPEDEDAIIPSHVPDRGLLINVFSLRWFERVRRQFTLRFRKRGFYKIGPARLQSGDLFGMYEHSQELDNTEFLTVFPDLVPFASLDLPAEDPFGDRRSRRRIFEDPNRPMGVREYRPEDSFRRVHWPATARMGELQVKVYQGIQDGYQVGLISNGCLAHSDRPFRIPPGRSPHQLAYLLEALAAVTPIVTAPFERYLVQEMPKVHYGASLVIVTAMTSPELIETLLQLKRKGRRITLISLATEAPLSIPGVRSVHLPFGVVENGC